MNIRNGTGPTFGWPQFHGGDPDTFITEARSSLLDFSANVNPLGLPKGVMDAVIAGLSSCDRYPDPWCRKLRFAIAKEEEVSAERIVCGNGAADLIYRLVGYKKPRRAMVTAPGFSEYEKALRESGCDVKRYRIRSENFEVTEELFTALTPDLDMVFLCNPNNPTGKTISIDRLNRIADHCERQDILLVVDECFNPFLDDPLGNTLIKRMHNESRDTNNLVILKAFTKIYAMAGLRLGYILCKSERLAMGVAQTGQPWSVSSPAQLAGIQALQEKQYLSESRRLIAAEREKMKNGLITLGMKSVLGEANYIFFQIPREIYGDSEQFFQAMIQRGFLLRNCSNYFGLDQGFFRVAVRLPVENDSLLQAILNLQA